MAAKLKPMKDDQEIAAIPLDQPVLVELAPEPSSAEMEAAPPAAAKQADNADASGVEQLTAQLERLKAAEKTQAEELARLHQEKAEAERRAVAQAMELRQSRSEREQALSDALTHSLAAAQSEQEAAEAEYAKAYESADPAAMAKAQGKIARAAAKVLNAEAAAAEVAERKERMSEDAPRQPEQRPADLVTTVRGNPNLLPTEKDWLLEHQDLLVDRGRGVELEAAYIRATRAGHVRGSDGYFQFLDKELGYATTKAETTDPDEGATIMNAPVSRDAVSVATGRAASGTRITLTPEQRAFAKSMGLSEVQYAAQVLKLNQDKRANPERYSINRG